MVITMTSPSERRTAALTIVMPTEAPCLALDAVAILRRLISAACEHGQHHVDTSTDLAS